MTSRGSPPSRASASFSARFWDGFFPRWYRLIRHAEPMLRRWLRRHRVGDTVELVVVGRRSGLPRSVLVGLLEVGPSAYVGHPTSASAWTSNLDVAGRCKITPPGRHPRAFGVVPLSDGPEREAVIRATFRQHPFPGNAIYFLARGHVRATGRFYRLEPLD